MTLKDHLKEHLHPRHATAPAAIVAGLSAATMALSPDMCEWAAGQWPQASSLIFGLMVAAHVAYAVMKYFFTTGSKNDAGKLAAASQPGNHPGDRHDDRRAQVGSDPSPR